MADYTLRAATEGDRAAVLQLLAASLGWGDDERFASFYAWKHEQSPFGRSRGLVAVDGDRVVGFRTFLRWEFVDAGGTRRRAVRAVDTATHPDHQGRGIFRALTLRAVEELTDEGLDFVFNTPNDRSRPGYLTMGWVEVGKLATSVRFGSPAAVVRMARSRVPAERWPAAPSGGRPAAEVLAAPGVTALLASLGPPTGLRTARTPEFLRWRYGYAPLGYRAVTVSDRAEDGLAVFRVRRRGQALEGALCEVLVPSGAADAARTLVRAVAGAAGADYLIRIGRGAARTGFVPLPRQGPMLTWRRLGRDVPGAAPADWDLVLGDVELF